MSDEVRVENDQRELRDEALSRLLQEWTVRRPAGPDRRLLAAFERQARPRGPGRVWTASVAVPVPLLAALLLAFALLCVRLCWPDPPTPAAFSQPEPTTIVLETRSLRGYRPLTPAELETPPEPAQ